MEEGRNRERKSRGKSTRKKAAVPVLAVVDQDGDEMMMQVDTTAEDEEKGKRKRVEMEVDASQHDTNVAQAVVSQFRSAPPQQPAMLVDLDGDDMEVPEVVEWTVETSRYFSCHDHYTELGVGSACTVVCATDIRTAQRAMELWLAANGLKTLADHPYQLHEIDVKRRGVVVVSYDNRMRSSSYLETRHVQRSARVRVFKYPDFYMGCKKYGNSLVAAGALVMAYDIDDARSIVTAFMRENGLIAGNKTAAIDAFEELDPSTFGPSGPNMNNCVFPLSVYTTEK